MKLRNEFVSSDSVNVTNIDSNIRVLSECGFKFYTGVKKDLMPHSDSTQKCYHRCFVSFCSGRTAGTHPNGILSCLI